MDIVNIFNALLTPVIAVLAVYIAYQQHVLTKKTSNRQNQLAIKNLNFELYQKRFSIFNETKELILKINTDSQIDIIELRDFKFKTNESYFLFGDEIIQYLEELRKNANKISYSTKKLDIESQYPVGSNARKELVEEHSELIGWFTYEYQNLETRFVKYLNFKNL